MPAGTMFTKLAVSVAVGFVGAYPLAVASGLMGAIEPGYGPPEGMLITISGIILFFLTLALIGPTVRLVHHILDTLRRVEERPRPAVAVTMLCLGTLCAISAMVIQYNAGHRLSQSVSMNLPGFDGNVPGMPMHSMNIKGFGGSPSLALQSSGSFGLGVLTLLTFLLGTSLIGLGIWASLKPNPPATIPTIKPAVREFDEVTT